jgi:thiamine biosynthesis lipoprotein
MMASLPTAAAEWSVWSTTVRLIVTDPAQMSAAHGRVARVIDTVDLATSRFRNDSEVRKVYQAQGSPVRVSALLAELVRLAVVAAEETDGDVDPTIGAWLCELGYDRNIGDIPARAARPRVSVHLAPDWRQIRLVGDELTVPAGFLLDLGATAKAYTSDRSAAAVAALGCGALVSIGGDIATAGPAPHAKVGSGRYWRVRVQDGPDEPGTTVTLPAGRAIATSSTLHRRWRRGEHVLHHIVDPRTGLSAAPVWRTATVAADDCVRANTASTAAVVRGLAAPAFLTRAGLPARLVATDGRVYTLNGWPADRHTPDEADLRTAEETGRGKADEAGRRTAEETAAA